MSTLNEAVPVDQVPKNLVTSLYGPPGVGKTILGVRTANKTLIVTDERASVSLSQFPEYSKNCSVIMLRDYDHLTGIIRDLSKESHDYDHCMIDTMDGVVQMKLAEQRRKIKQFNRGHPDISSLEDYNLLSNHFDGIIKRLARLPLSVTVTSHERIPDPQGYAKGDRLLRPSMPFRIFERLNGYANVVGYMSMTKRNGDLIRTVTVQANDEFTAKNHLNMSPTVSDDVFVKTVREWKGI